MDSSQCNFIRLETGKVVPSADIREDGIYKPISDDPPTIPANAPVISIAEYRLLLRERK